jgi:hypothetical protein
MKKLLVTGCVIAGCGFIVLTAQETAQPGVYTAAQADAGRAAYLTSCAKCHTAALTGRTGAPGELPPLDSLPAVMQEVVRGAGGVVPALTGPEFIARWKARTTRDLSRRVDEAVGGFPPEGRDKDTYLNLTAYFLRAIGARAGTQALTAATAVEIRAIALPASQ